MDLGGMVPKVTHCYLRCRSESLVHIDDKSNPIHLHQNFLLSVVLLVIYQDKIGLDGRYQICL